MKIIKGFFMAWGNFCSIPCPYRPWDEDARLHMLTMFPVLGAGMGLLWVAIAMLLGRLGIPDYVTASAMCVYPFIVSGSMHLDGFMDCSDAIGSRAPTEKKLMILKDSHVGAFAVIWLAIVFILGYGGMLSFVSQKNGYASLVAIPAISRCISALNIINGRSILTSQYTTLGSERTKFSIALVVEVMIILVLTYRMISVEALIVAATAAIGTEAWIAYGRKQLGGMSGDISGYGIVWGETIAIIVAGCIM